VCPTRSCALRGTMSSLRCKTSCTTNVSLHNLTMVSRHWWMFVRCALEKIEKWRHLHSKAIQVRYSTCTVFISIIFLSTD
jgi:hypothetical protein